MQQKIIIFFLTILILIFLPACINTNMLNSNNSSIKKNTIEKDTFNNQQIYYNDTYNFSIKYSKNWYLNDCCASYFLTDNEPNLMIFLSSTENISCGTRWQNRRIYITIEENENIYTNTENENYKKKEIIINGLKANQYIFNHEILDDEGKMTKTRPILKRIITFIPFQDKFITLNYNELYKFLGDLEGEPVDVKPQENFEEIYNEIVTSFEFNQPTPTQSLP